MKSFGSDNHSGIHPRILQAIAEANTGHVHAYGDDPYTAEAVADIRRVLANELAEVFFVFNGTGTNCLSIIAANNSFNSVICSDTAHINVDECGAPERLSGGKLIAVPNVNGKLTVQNARSELHDFGFEHHSQPGLISITQSTELGTVYTLEEIKALSDLAHSHGMYLHVDGARFANGVVSLGVSAKDMVQGVDILSFGGTKNGMMMGEAVVILNPLLARNFKYKRKQSMQLCSKMRFLSAQFSAYLKDDLWLTLAAHSNEMARLLASMIGDYVEIVRPVEANGVFAIIPIEAREKLLKEHFFYVWNETTSEVRLMCSFDTTKEDIERFAEDIIKAVQ